jgi:hypothetical protein
VGILAPASKVAYDALYEGIEILKEDWKLNIIEGQTLRTDYHQFSAHDELRLHDLQMMLTFRFGDRVAIGEKDWLEPTLTIFNSYDLSMNLSLEVGAKRLVCLNGLMAYSRFAGGRHKHVGKVRNLIDSSDVSRQIGHFIENVVPLWRKSAEFELSLDEADGVFKYAHEKVGMPITLIDAAQKVWKGRAAMDEVERPSTAWILYNTLTNVITHQRGMNLRKEMALARQKALQEQSFKLLSDIVEGGRG